MTSLRHDIEELLELAQLERDDRDSIANARVAVVGEISRAARVRAQAKQELREAQHQVREAKDAWRNQEMLLSKRYRAELTDGGGKVTESMITAEVELDPRWKVARDAFRTAELAEIDAQMLDDLAYGMWAALQAKLTMAGSLAADHRAEVQGDPSMRREAREAREERELERDLKF